MPNNKKKSKITPDKAVECSEIIENNNDLFSPYCPFDFSKMALDDIQPYDTHLWSQLLEFQYEEMFCFINANLVCSKPSKFSIRTNPRLAEQSAITPVNYWAVGLHVPELEAYLFQHQNVFFGPSRRIEGQIVTTWVNHRSRLLDKLHDFLELYYEHDRLLITITDKIEGVPILDNFYTILSKITQESEAIYQKKYDDSAWPALQLEYAHNISKENAKANVKEPNKEVDSRRRRAPKKIKSPKEL